MGEKYLPSDTQFICTLNVEHAPFTCSGNSKAVISGHGGMLTSLSKGKPSGTCLAKPAPGGGFLPCTCVLTGWSGVSGNCTLNGISLLLEKSFNICGSGGGTIKPAGVLNNKAFTGAASASSPEIKNISFPSAYEPEIENNESGKGDKSAEAVPDASTGKAAMLRKGKQDFRENMKILQNMLCSGECSPEKRARCRYFLDHKTRPDEAVTVNNKSQILAENYEFKMENEKNRDEIDRIYYSAKTQFPNFSYAAHHIISGNQVLKKETELVRLADFLTYDINNAENCIFLVSKEEGYGNIKKGKRNISAYDAMNSTRLQWHLGGHEYSFSEDELPEIRKHIERKYHRKFAKIRSYADLLQEKVSDLSEQLRQEQRCWYNEDPQKQRENQKYFLQQMNRISRKVRKKLGDFAIKPDDSYPWYVSKEAYRYAFTLPESGKIIIVRQKSEGILSLRKYRVRKPKREADTNETNVLILKPVEKDGFAAEYILYCKGTHGYSSADQKECVLFCENIGHFLFVNRDFTEQMPFSPDFTHVFMDQGEESEGDQMLFNDSRNQVELQTWLRDENFDHYMSPIVIIQRRLEEWEDNHESG